MSSYKIIATGRQDDKIF